MKKKQKINPPAGGQLQFFSPANPPAGGRSAAEKIAVRSLYSWFLYFTLGINDAPQFAKSHRTITNVCDSLMQAF